MTDKNLFHTITIKIPANMVYKTKTGRLKLVPTLTKTGNLTRREKEPSIIFQPDDFIIHPEVINTGSQIIYPQSKARKPRAKKEKVVGAKGSTLKATLSEEEELLPEESKQVDIDEIISLKDLKGLKEEPVKREKIKQKKIDYFTLLRVIGAYRPKDFVNFFNKIGIEQPPSTFTKDEKVNKIISLYNEGYIANKDIAHGNPTNTIFF